MTLKGLPAATSLEPLCLPIPGHHRLLEWEGVWPEGAISAGPGGAVVNHWPSPSPRVGINCNGCNKESQIGEMIPSSPWESLGCSQGEREKEREHAQPCPRGVAQPDTVPCPRGGGSRQEEELETPPPNIPTATVY